MTNQKTHSPKTKEIVRTWHFIDLSGRVLGRTATDIAALLMGKNKVTFSPHLDQGDFVVAINAAKIKVTGKKTSQKVYYRHTGFPDGLRERTFAQLMEKDPRKIIRHAVSGMLPKNKLRDPRLGRLKIFSGVKHPYEKRFASVKKE